MSYKRVVSKKGKNYGPYIYESYRDSHGVVRKRYLGRVEKSNTKNFIFIALAIVVLASLFFISYTTFFNSGKTTGFASLDIKESYSAGEFLSGILELNLKQGELVPADSKIIIEQNGNLFEFNFSDFADSNSEGSFFVENANISGQGEGYGFEGSRLIYPYVYFTLLLSDDEVINSPGSGNDSSSSEVENPAEDNITLPVENISVETPAENTSVENPVEENPIETPTENPIETPIETPADTTDSTEAPAETSSSESSSTSDTTSSESSSESSSSSSESSSSESSSDSSSSSETSSSESSSDSSSVLTGNVILASDNLINGVVSKNQSFEYNTDKYASLDDVYSDYESLSPNVLNLKNENGKIIVTTDYSYEEKGYGSEFLGGDGIKIKIDLNKLNILAQNGTITISLVYNNLSLAEASKNLVVGSEEEKELNKTIIANETLANETILNDSLSIIREIGQIEIAKNSNYTLNLNNYFSGAMSYSVESIENISLNLQGSNLLIVPDENFTGERLGSVEAFDLNNSLSLEFSILVLDLEFANLSVQTKNYNIIINRPVKWQKKILGTNESNINIEIPKEAENITVKLGEEIAAAEEQATEEQNSLAKNKTALITGQVVHGKVSLDIKENKGIVTMFFDWLSLRFTGNVIVSNDITETENSKIVNVELEPENNSEVLVEYFTPAPTSNEIATSNGKQIIISADEKWNYTNILAYTALPNTIKIENNQSIRLYHYVWHDFNVNEVDELINETETEIFNVTEISNATEIAEVNESINSSEIFNSSSVNLKKEEKQQEKDAKNDAKDNKKESKLTGKVILEGEVSQESLGYWAKEETAFASYDLDEDGNVDYIEWLVPHLSNQTYEIIYITHAEHLDSERNFVSDVYDSVKELDGNYTSIPDGDYLRVSFEQNLTNKKDITIYAQSGNVSVGNASVPYDVYAMKKRIDEIREELGNG